MRFHHSRFRWRRRHWWRRHIRLASITVVTTNTAAKTMQTASPNESPSQLSVAMSAGGATSATASALSALRWTFEGLRRRAGAAAGDDGSMTCVGDWVECMAQLWNVALTRR